MYMHLTLHTKNHLLRNHLIFARTTFPGNGKNKRAIGPISRSPESKFINIRKSHETPMAGSIITLGDIILTVFVQSARSHGIKNKVIR